MLKIIFNNYFSNSETLNLLQKTGYSYKIEKTDIEYKLGEPYNRCTQTYPGTGEQNYRQANCIDICRNRVIKEKKNCSIPSYYEIVGLNSCTYMFSIIYREIDNECHKECPEQFKTTKFNLNLERQSESKVIHLFQCLSQISLHLKSRRFQRWMSMLLYRALEVLWVH